jgi:hypothetical protein
MIESFMGDVSSQILELLFLALLIFIFTIELC